MKQSIRKFVVTLLILWGVAGLMMAIVEIAKADNCRVRSNVVVLDTGLTIAPFALPVGVPVVPATTGLYSYNATAQAYQPRAAAQAYTEEQKQAAEWAYWRGKLTDEQYAEIIGQMQAKAAAVKAQAAPVSPFAATCVKCHSQGGVGFAHHDFSKPLTDGDKLKAIKAVMTGKMPPKRVLEPQVRSDVIAELSGVNEVKAAVVPQPPMENQK